MRHWSHGGPSDLSNGVLLCTRCHHRIHDDGWTVTATTTEVWFTPPASIDPQRTPRRGGKTALQVDLPPRTPATASPPG
ncbi:HNH endonuclease [Demequina gelatinilytica]|uniref:HNH endonuclease n=1 Tax=Demequina gelatinilytica TaxID=1638980 RepID=UPI001E454DD7|nr:HNH endonuclease [Demequina gelatinilytica]